MPMKPEQVFQRLRDDLSPQSGAQDRIAAKISGRITSPAVSTWSVVRGALSPSEEAKTRVWARISENIVLPAERILASLREEILPPAEGFQPSFFDRLRPVAHHRAHPFLRWGAALAVIALVLRIAPAALLAPSTVAKSTILIRPVHGDVFVVHVNTLEPLTGEQSMEQPIRLRTGNDGSLTVAAHDDYVVRFDADADVEWYDISDRPEPSIDGPTFALRSGHIWLQGLVPSHVHGITVATPAGDIVVHEGSVDIDVSDRVLLRVFDRTAVVQQNGRSISLVAGEQTELWPHGWPTVTQIEQEALSTPWVTRNSSYDAVHRREIAQWQRERRAAQAGILPTSTLYPAKRALERVAEITTLSSEGKAQQKLAQADSRLNEAAALLEAGDVATASASLEEYRSTLLALSGSGDSVTQFLIRQKVAEDTAGLAAALPDDNAYLLKRTALQAGADVQETVIPEHEVQDMLLVDVFATLDEAVLDGDLERASSIFLSLEPTIQTMDTDIAVAPTLRKQGQAVLRRYAIAIRKQPLVADIDPALLQETVSYLPVPQGYLPLSQQEIAEVVGGILDRTIGIYRTERGLTNSFTLELQQLKGHQDEARILDMLLQNVMSNDLLSPYVRWRIRELRGDRTREAL